MGVIQDGGLMSAPTEVASSEGSPPSAMRDYSDIRNEVSNIADGNYSSLDTATPPNQGEDAVNSAAVKNAVDEIKEEQEASNKKADDERARGKIAEFGKSAVDALTNKENGTQQPPKQRYIQDSKTEESNLLQMMSKLEATNNKLGNMGQFSLTNQGLKFTPGFFSPINFGGGM